LFLLLRASIANCKLLQNDFHWPLVSKQTQMVAQKLNWQNNISFQIYCWLVIV
jgi:hypothetical protein